MRIMITGPQGCGKTTQAKLLAGKLGLPMIGVGDLLRELAKEDSDRGRLAKEWIDTGSLADDRLVASLVRELVDSAAYQKGFVTDGYPRTLSQHQLFDPGFDRVFYLDVSHDEVIKRLLSRGREDDTPDKIEKRLAWYQSQTKPLLDIFRDQGNLIVINGEQPIDKITADIAGNIPDTDPELPEAA